MNELELKSYYTRIKTVFAKKNSREINTSLIAGLYESDEYTKFIFHRAVLDRGNLLMNVNTRYNNPSAGKNIFSHTKNHGNARLNHELVYYVIFAVGLLRYYIESLQVIDMYICC